MKGPRFFDEVKGRLQCDSRGVAATKGIESSPSGRSHNGAGPLSIQWMRGTKGIATMRV